MKRRRILVGGVGAIAFLSGCTGEQSNQASSAEADMRVDGINLQPREIELREETTVEISVTNHGEGAGSGELWYSVGRDRRSFVVDLEGGETGTFSESFNFEGVGDVNVELDATRTSNIRDLDHTATISVGPKKLSVNQAWENYEGYTISADEPDFRETYQAKSGITGEVETNQPPEEDQFAFVHVTVENDGNGSGTVPSPSDFFARVDSELYDLGVQPLTRRPDFVGDLEDIELYTSGEIPPGTTKSGYVVFDVPSNAEDDYQTGWSSRYSPDQVIYWE